MVHAPTEMVLTRQCADVSKLKYHMRMNGDVSDHDLLASFEGQHRVSVSTSPRGTCRTTLGGRPPRGSPAASAFARPLAWPCPLFCRIMSRHLVTTVVEHFCAAFGATGQMVLAEYGTRTDGALARLVSTLPTAAAQELLPQPDEALSERELLWQNVLTGSEDAMRDLPSPSLRHAWGITPDDGDGDDERPLARKRIQIQGVIAACVDSGVCEGLLLMYESEGSWAARRLNSASWLYLRLADVLTSTLGNACTPLDISICSTQAQQAGTDCTRSRLAAKLNRLPSLLRQNICYTPIVWCACGRPHQDTLTVLRSLSKSTARKRNFVSADVVFQTSSTLKQHVENLETECEADSFLLGCCGPSYASGPGPPARGWGSLSPVFWRVRSCCGLLQSGLALASLLLAPRACPLLVLPCWPCRLTNLVPQVARPPCSWSVQPAVFFWLSASVRLCFPSRLVAPRCAHRSHVSRRLASTGVGATCYSGFIGRTRSPKASAPSSPQSPRVRRRCPPSLLGHGHAHAPARAHLHRSRNVRRIVEALARC